MPGAANDTINVLNPYAQMAWVPPEMSTKVTVKLYAAVGSLAVFLWDIMLHVSDDYKLLWRYRINYSIVIYWISRLTTLVYLLGIVITATAPIGNCNYMRYVQFIYPVTVPLTILLFVFRVNALYDGNKFVVAFFSLSWLAVFASSIVLPFGVVGLKLGPTNYCIEMQNTFHAAFAALCIFVHETLIFVATSWAFMRYSYFDVTVKNKLKAMVVGQHLPAFSKSILHNGQAYYVCTLVVHLFYIGLFYSHDPFATPCTFGIPVSVLINTMACHVYRNIRLGFYNDFTFRTTAEMEPGNVSSIRWQESDTRWKIHSMIDSVLSSSERNRQRQENGDQMDKVEIVQRHSKVDQTPTIDV